LAASRLASEPAGSLIRMIRVRRDSCEVNPKNSALCELFTSDLRCDVCNVRARGVKDVVTAFLESLRRLDRGGNRLRMIVTPNSFRKKTPHPTRERRAGQRTDLVSPTASETTKTEVVPNG
jgi:hypothetical protein